MDGSQNLDEAHSSPGLHAAAGPGLAEECATLVIIKFCLATIYVRIFLFFIVYIGSTLMLLGGIGHNLPKKKKKKGGIGHKIFGSLKCP